MAALYNSTCFHWSQCALNARNAPVEMSPYWWLIMADSVGVTRLVLAPWLLNRARSALFDCTWAMHRRPLMSPKPARSMPDFAGGEKLEWCGCSEDTHL